jgi:hypothetical protein
MFSENSFNQSLKLESLPGSYTFHKLTTGSKIPEISDGFYSITSTEEEISIVCLDQIQIKSRSSSRGWKCLRVSGPLQLDLVGILHQLTRPLKDAGISVNAISTYNTDYLFVPGSSYRAAMKALSAEFDVKQG